jgi:FHA domain
MTEQDVTPPIQSDDSSLRSRRILEAVSYLQQCRKSARSFAIVIDDAAPAVQLATDRFLAGISTPKRLARIRAPIDSSHLFLEAILAQLGFESFASTTDDLLRLLTVVMRQRSEGQDPICIVLENAQDFGPRVFETLRELARNSRDESWSPLFVLTGNRALLRVLDSKGMSSVATLTRHRFDMATPSDTGNLAVEAAGQSQPEGPELVLSLDHETIQSFPIDGMRLLIGRGPHCDICIRSRFVSRQHALLIHGSDGDWLVDLKSTNGTSVNSKLITQRRLVHGDVISLGNHQLQYVNPSGRLLEVSGAPSHDQLSETIVMRSLQSARIVRDAAPHVPERTPTAA